jgi:hypothetical protein
MSELGQPRRFRDIFAMSGLRKSRKCQFNVAIGSRACESGCLNVGSDRTESTDRFTKREITEP